MSLVQQLESIGANAQARYNSNKDQLSEDLQELIDTCPDIIAFLIPAEEEESNDDDKEQDSEEQTKNRLAL